MSYLYRFGSFVLDAQKRTLSCNESLVPLTAKAFDVLVFLAQNSNRVITKDELLKAVWGDTFVEEGNLTQYISHLRRALADQCEDNRLIVTIARKGYQFTADVARIEIADGRQQPEAQVPTSGVSTTEVAVEAGTGNLSPQTEAPSATGLSKTRVK